MESDSNVAPSKGAALIKDSACSPNKGFGVFTPCARSKDEVAVVVPLDLSINPMRVLQDPSIGARCKKMVEEDDVHNQFLTILFLTVECLRPNSLWKPYFNMLPTTFGNPLWFTEDEDELAELKGTALHRASVLQRKNLQALFAENVKFLVDDAVIPAVKIVGYGKAERGEGGGHLAGVMIYFALGLLLSAYGCYHYINKVSGDRTERMRLDSEHSSYISSMNGESENGSHSMKNSMFQDNQNIRRPTGFGGYLFQIIYQTNAGMHSINAVYLLGDTALNCSQFP